MLTFKISKSTDLQITHAMLTNLHNDPAGSYKRLKGRGIPKTIIDLYLNNNHKNGKKLLKTFIAAFYQNNKDKLDSALNHLQHYWKPTRINILTNRLKSLLNISCKQRFTCIVSGFFSTSAWYGDTFSVWYKHHKNGIINQISAIEYIESLVHCYINKYKPTLLTDYQKWALSEAIAFNIVYIDPTIKNKLWPDINITYKDANYYPQIKEFIKKVGDIMFGKENGNKINILLKKAANLFKES